MRTHDSAAILSIGDELVLGQTLDTNSRWLSEALGELNIRVVEHVTIADNLDGHAAAIRRLSAAVPLVISTGGLGPTADDLTRHALAEVLGEELVCDEEALREIEAIFARRGRAMNQLQRVQALRPLSARRLVNRNGTAPGLAAVMAGAEHTGCDVFCLPGPPNEMRPMFLDSVRPALRPPTDRRIGVRVLHTLGLGEGDLATRLGALMDRGRNPLVGTTASGGVVSIRIRCDGLDAAGTEHALDETERACRRAAEPFIFGATNQTIASATLDILTTQQRTLVTAESCTGGLIGELLTAVPGSSRTYLGGWVTYSNGMKTSELGVTESLLQHFGAVSSQVAEAMALGALMRVQRADHAIAITGIAGPGGGTTEKPVGTVFITVARREGRQEEVFDTRRFFIPGGRDAVRDRAAKLSLAMLRFQLLGLPTPPLLWEFRA